MRHLAIFVGKAIENIFSGKKTIESRFTQDKILPYGSIKKADEIYLKQSGGLVFGKVIVDNVLFYENLGGEDIGKLRKEYGKDLCVGESFWEDKAKSRYASIIFLKNPQRFLTAFKFKKKDRRPWILMEKE